MTIQSNESIRRLIDARHAVVGFIASLKAKQFSKSSLTRDQLIELLRAYNPIDPIKFFVGPHRPLTKLYFYYLTLDSSGTISCKRFFHDYTTVDIFNNDEEVLRLIDTWIDAPMTGVAVDIEALEWCGPCVIAFAMNPGSWSFFEDGGRGTIQFPHGEVISEGTTIIYNANKTFFENRVLNSSKRRQILLVNNYHMRADGSGPRPANHPGEHYKFDLYFRVPVRKPDNSTAHVTVVVDPGGQNLGP